MLDTPIPDPATSQVKVRAALRAWHSAGGISETPLSGWLLVHQQLEATEMGDPTALCRATNHLLEAGLKELANHDRRGAEVLQARYEVGLTAEEVAAQFNLTRDIVNHVASAAVERLSAILLNQEQAARQEHIQAQQARLQPPQYDRLLGLTQTCAQLIEQLLSPTPPWVIAIVGIGGIGKTALADAVTRLIIHNLYFEHVIWLRLASYQTTVPNLTFETFTTQLLEALLPQAYGASSEQRVTQIRSLLKARPYLIVIDNLETEADTAYLLDHLNDLASPSKFLLTSRTRLTGQAALFNVSLDELPARDAYALLRHQAAAIGLKELEQADEAHLESIYKVVGGNPLALKLVVGLATVQSLSQILADLVSSPVGEIGELYRRIYWKSWQALSSQARALLQAMPLIAEPGALPAQLRAISKLSEIQLSVAITELAMRSLIEVRGTVWERRYGIHRLTETFLQTDINHWSEA